MRGHRGGAVRRSASARREAPPRSNVPLRPACHADAWRALAAVSLEPMPGAPDRAAVWAGRPVTPLLLRSLHGDAGGLDRRRPFGDLTFDQVAEMLRRRILIGNDFGAEPGQAVMHRGRMHRRERGVVELLNDRFRSALG